MPNKTEVWQRIISYCDSPGELSMASKFIYRTAHLDNTKAMWILRHPDSDLTKKLLTQQILLILLRSEIDYYNQSPFLDFETEKLLSALLEQQNFKHFAQLLDYYQPTHKLQKLLHFASILVTLEANVAMWDTLLHWSKEEFNAKLVHLTIKANNTSVMTYLLSRHDILKDIDWYDLKETHFKQLLEIMKQNNLIQVDSSFIISDLTEVIINRDLASCLTLLIESGMTIHDEWQLHLAVVKNSVNCAKVLLEHGADPHVDNDICILDAASLGYTRLVHMFSKHADKQLLQKALYSAIQIDQPEVVALLLEMPGSSVKCDQQAFYLASTKHGTKKESSRQLTVLQLLLASSSDVVYLSFVGKNAVKMVSDYCKQVFSNIATVSK